MSEPREPFLSILTDYVLLPASVPFRARKLYTSSRVSPSQLLPSSVLAARTNFSLPASAEVRWQVVSFLFTPASLPTLRVSSEFDGLRSIGAVRYIDRNHNHGDRRDVSAGLDHTTTAAAVVYIAAAGVYSATTAESIRVRGLSPVEGKNHRKSEHGSSPYEWSTVEGHESPVHGHDHHRGPTPPKPRGKTDGTACHESHLMLRDWSSVEDHESPVHGTTITGGPTPLLPSNKGGRLMARPSTMAKRAAGRSELEEDDDGYGRLDEGFRLQYGILVADVFRGKDTLLFAGLLSSLAAAGTWLQVASYYGWPVSTTHCIVGSMVGFGLAYGGTGAVFWSSLARVTSSWVVSPLVGAMVSFLVYKCIRRFVYSAPNPGQAAAAAAPIAVFMGVTGISFAAFPLSQTFSIALAQALACGAAGAILVDRIIRRQLGHLLANSSDSNPGSKSDGGTKGIGFLSDIAGPTGTQLEIVYGVFGYMQVLSACFMSFAHGGNDVSNAIGPLAAALSILQGRAAAAEIVIPNDVLAWGGFGIVAGLMMWGYRVIATIGKKITELTPTRGFAAEFAAASVVLGASKLGLPISATHTLVGAVMGVGFARGLNSVRAETVREIVTSWAVTIPAGATFAVVYTWILTKLLSVVL
ncbi:Inorganic phosphate transporter 2-1-chloroplastic [Striga hermonthica]|uniref:Phosphate transporter n=1 Tax=Striga hermonthica TaxID=68872 RepID=A0A9N7NFX6_STRHE|nr:Inorganic phosphate transporter 2-1-chloroplastic [Striga hermonthica]